MIFAVNQNDRNIALFYFAYDLFIYRKTIARKFHRGKQNTVDVLVDIKIYHLFGLGSGYICSVKLTAPYKRKIKGFGQLCDSFRNRAENFT